MGKSRVIPEFSNKQMNQDLPTLELSGGLEGFEGVVESFPAERALKCRLKRLANRGLLSAEAAQAIADSKAGGLEAGGLEIQIGENNFLPAWFLPVGAERSVAICRIATSGTNYQRRRGRWKGTGFLVGPNILLTNHHVLNSVDVARNATCEFLYEHTESGRLRETVNFRLNPDRLFITSPVVTTAHAAALDYTFVWIEGRPHERFEPLSLGRSNISSSLGEFANVISHPDGRPKEIAVQENKIEFQDTIRLQYTTDTEGGSSGAPVFNNEWSLIALHHKFDVNTPASGHSVLNEGIKLSAIAASLERMIASGDNAASAREVLRLFSGNDELLGYFGSLGRQTAPGSDLEAVVDSYKGTETDIDVGFWNVEWFTKYYDEKVDAVAEVVHEMNLDLWVLVESSPKAVRALRNALNDDYGLSFAVLDAEPDSGDGKQSCSVLWNTETLDVDRMEWGEPIESWLQVDSRDFDELGLEAVEGKVFNRYPALFRVSGKGLDDGRSFDFNLVPLHLKARGEGSKRRRMASRILAAAIARKNDEGADLDWVVGGDFNAELGSSDFDGLTSSMTPISATDEDTGAFTYIKSPYKSLIDHVFLSPSLAQEHGEDDFFIVAADRPDPRDFLRDLSDHRPILVRLSLGDLISREDAGPDAEPDPVIDELLHQISGHGPPVPCAADTTTEAAARDYHDRSGYDPAFLGNGDLHVPLPELTGSHRDDVLVVAEDDQGNHRLAIPYEHFSVVMNKPRRLAFYTAVNIDGSSLIRGIRRTGWMFDPRIEDDHQAGNELYRNNDIDRGHLVRRLDPIWGDRDSAVKANRDTFHYTNAAPQHKDLNQREWLALEDFVIDNAGARDLRVSVFTGPVLDASDVPYRGFKIPRQFWKVVVWKKDSSGELGANGYMLTQEGFITGLEADFGPFGTYQVPVRKIEQLARLDFGAIKRADPLETTLEAAFVHHRISSANDIAFE